MGKWVDGWLHGWMHGWEKGRRKREKEDEGGVVEWNLNSATKSIALTKVFNSKSLSFLVCKVVKTILTMQGYCTSELQLW